MLEDQTVSAAIKAGGRGTSGYQVRPDRTLKGDEPRIIHVYTWGTVSPGTGSSLSTGQSQRKSSRQRSVANLVSDRSQQTHWVTLRHRARPAQTGKQQLLSRPGTPRLYGRRSAARPGT